MKKAAIITFVILAAAGAGRAVVETEQLYPLLNQANEAFRNANSQADKAERNRLYEKAVLIYEKIINEGKIYNPKLYYNLGNAYLLKGDAGRAIVNYRRAERIDSGDGNIQKNLSFARGMRIDKVAEKTQERVLKTLFFWHYDLSLKGRSLMTCIFFAVVCTFSTIMVWVGRKGALTVGIVIFGILTIMFLSSVIYQAGSDAKTVCGVITAGEVIARQGDAENYPASFKEPLHSGTEFDVLENRTSWLHIKLADGSQAWIPSDSAEII
jgi:tetratricopeptide (TPR) repeat protein